MKHIIFAILFLVAFVGMGAVPHAAFAKRHHVVRRARVRRARARRVVYRRRTVYVGSRSHGIGANGNVGVGLGPIHVGVGAGGGIQLHEALPPQHVLPDDPPSYPRSSVVAVPGSFSAISASGPAATRPAAFADTAAAFVDTAAEVIVSHPVVVATVQIPEKKTENERLISHNTATYMEPYAPVDIQYLDQQYALSPDDHPNSYYATYTQPQVVTVGGFDVPVNRNTMYYSPFKRGRNGFWYVHNQKGVDVTAGYGVSPRAGAIPESIGGAAYTVIPLGR